MSTENTTATTAANTTANTTANTANSNGEKTTPSLTSADVTKLIESSLGSFEGKLLETMKSLMSQSSNSTTTQTNNTQTHAQVTTSASTAEHNTELARLKKVNEDAMARLKKMEDSAKAADERAEQANQATFLNNILNSYEFQNAAARDDAFNSVKSLVNKAQDGSYVATDGRTLEAAIGDILTGAKSYLLKPEPSFGSGTTGGNFKAQVAGTRVSMEDIKPGASEEVMKQAAIDIVRAYRR